MKKSDFLLTTFNLGVCMKYILTIFISILPIVVSAENITIRDSVRDRSIPIEINFPIEYENCTHQKRCQVAFVSAGNHVPFTKYKFITKSLNEHGYMTVSIDHELPNDPPLSKTGDLYQTRIENWKRGAKTIKYLKGKLESRFPTYDFNKLTLVGHSNGGDISAWFSNDNNDYIHQLITLDSKRVSLPKNNNIRVLSIRSPEYPTALGVLPTIEDQKLYGICIVDMSASKHMDFTDFGVDRVQKKTIKTMLGFLKNKTCTTLRSEIE